MEQNDSRDVTEQGLPLPRMLSEVLRARVRKDNFNEGQLVTSMRNWMSRVDTRSASG